MNRLKAEKLLLLVTALYILFAILGWQDSFIHPENPIHDQRILSHGLHMQLSDLKFGLDWRIFEDAPRPYRPFSSYFEILDTHFRAWLWNYVVPHPSLSLTWIFSLVISPLLLFRFLRGRGISKSSSLLATTVFLASPGVLSTTALLFRPGKPMTNFSILFCLCLADRYRARIEKNVGLYLLTLALVFLSFFWDESALILYPVFLVFNFELVTRRSLYLVSYLALPALTYFTYFKILPALAVAAGVPSPDTAQYYVLRGAQHPTFTTIPENILILFRESLGLLNPGLVPWSLGKALIAACFGATAFLIFRSVPRFLKEKGRRGFLFRVLLCLFGAGAYHAILMSANQSDLGTGVWGLYYYGAYFSIFFAMLIGGVFDAQGDSPRWTQATAAICVMNLLFVFPFTHRGYFYSNSQAGEDRRVHLVKMFENRVNRFTDKFSPTPDIYLLTRKAWEDVHGGKPCHPMALEAAYICDELPGAKEQ